MKPITKNSSKYAEYEEVANIRHQLTTDLRQSGVSANGVEQLFAAEIITGLGDRNVLAQIIKPKTTNEGLGWNFHWGGITAQGAQQILNSQPITNANDRRRFASVVASISSHGEILSWFDEMVEVAN